jgi:hypothetical protein
MLLALVERGGRCERGAEVNRRAAVQDHRGGGR